MRKWLQEMVRGYESLAIVLGACGAVVTAAAWIALTFMTVSAGEKAEARQMLYTDSAVKMLDTRISRNENTLNEIKSVLDRIDQRVYDLHKESEHHVRKTGD